MSYIDDKNIHTLEHNENCSHHQHTIRANVIDNFRFLETHPDNLDVTAISSNRDNTDRSMIAVNKIRQKNVIDINEVTSSESSCNASKDSDEESFSEVNSNNLKELHAS